MSEVGSIVIYIDEKQIEHFALVTNIFEGVGSTDVLNLTYVDPNVKCEDNYGRGLIRKSSIVHISQNVAQANCWKIYDPFL